MNMSTNFNSSYPLDYTGLNTGTHPKTVDLPRAPLTTDWRSFNPGDMVRDTSVSPPVFYICESVSGDVAIWGPISTDTSKLSKLSDDSGNFATPSLGIVQIAGGTNIATSAAGNVMTVNIDGIVSVPNGGTGVDTLTGVITGNAAAAFTASPVTQYNVLVAGASNAIGSVAPSTAGIPLISKGAAINPAFDTALVVGGGTGIATTTAYAPICGGTTATGAFQAATTGFANAGFVLTSNGNAALPDWQVAPAATGINSILRFVFTIADTGTNYVPSAGLKYADVEVIGGGGGGSGSAGATGFGGSGGGAGGYARKLVPAATIGASQVLTIGAAGAAGASGGGAGGAGGTSSLGAIVSATGGAGGPAPSDAAAAGGGGVGGDFNTVGGPGFAAKDAKSGTGPTCAGEAGGNTLFGGAGRQTPQDSDGIAATSYGGGGSGAGGFNNHTGGAGFSGVIIITEYIT